MAYRLGPFAEQNPAAPPRLCPAKVRLGSGRAPSHLPTYWRRSGEEASGSGCLQLKRLQLKRAWLQTAAARRLSAAASSASATCTEGEAGPRRDAWTGSGVGRAIFTNRYRWVVSRTFAE